MSEQTLAYEAYLAALPPERRGEVDQVWRAVREAMPAGYTEEIGPRFLVFKSGEEHYVALANHKSYISLYLVPIYVYPALKEKLDASDKKVQCGKSCINFKKAAALPLEIIGEIVGATQAEDFRAYVEQVRRESKDERAAKR